VEGTLGALNNCFESIIGEVFCGQQGEVCIWKQTLRIFGHAVWVNQCSSDFPINDESSVEALPPQICFSFFL